MNRRSLLALLAALPFVRWLPKAKPAAPTLAADALTVDDEWVHVAEVWTGGRRTVYVNGVLVTTGVHASPSRVFYSQPFDVQEWPS